VTVADQLREQGRKEGHREGHKEGLQQQCKLVLKQLSLRFGALPDAAVAQVNAADFAQLEVWAERLLTAPTLAEVLTATAAAEERPF
jgi:predicted transposase YdaD